MTIIKIIFGKRSLYFYDPDPSSYALLTTILKDIWLFFNISPWLRCLGVYTTSFSKTKIHIRGLVLPPFTWASPLAFSKRPSFWLLFLRLPLHENFFNKKFYFHKLIWVPFLQKTIIWQDLAQLQAKTKFQGCHICLKTIQNGFVGCPKLILWSQICGIFCHEYHVGTHNLGMSKFKTDFLPCQIFASQWHCLPS